MLAESLASACRLSQKHIQQFRKGEGTEQKPSCCSVVPLWCRMLSYCHPKADGVRRGAKKDKADGLRASPACLRGEGDTSPVP